MKAKQTEKYCTHCLIVKPVEEFRPHFKRVRGERRRRGWNSRCRVCLHKKNKEREKGRRQSRVQLSRTLRWGHGQRKRLDALESRLAKAHRWMEHRIRLCKFCGERFLVPKKSSGAHRSRLCDTCLPLKGLTSTGKFRILVKQIVETENDGLALHLIKVFASRSLTVQSNGKIVVSARWFLAKLVEQEYRCAICRLKTSGNLPAIDHNHTTGELRGLLCSTCNLAVGLLENRKVSMQAVESYLSPSPV